MEPCFPVNYYCVQLKRKVEAMLKAIYGRKLGSAAVLEPIDHPTSPSFHGDYSGL